MKFLNWLFKSKPKPEQPEDSYKVTITETSVRVEHPERETEQIDWQEIQDIKIITTDQGPWLPDVWLALLGLNNGCLIPQGADGWEAVYDIVSQYEGFDFNNVIESMKSSENAEFILWTRP